MDIGISRDELIEFFDWLYENKPTEFSDFMVFRKLKEDGII